MTLMEGLLWTLLSPAVLGAAIRPMELGTEAPDFKDLPVAVGDPVSLGDFKQDVLVIIVTCNECPVARSYEPRFVAFAKKYAGDKGSVGLLAINPFDRDGDRLEDMAKRARESSLPFPYAQDPGQEVSKTLGAQKTPHVFVFDKERKLAYQGAFDDSWIDASSVKHHYLEEVVQSLRTGSEVHACTKPEGCAIHFDR